MEKTLLKAPVLAFGTATLLSGCVIGNFDAAKSFASNEEAYRLLSSAPLVQAADIPTGSVSYSGGILVEREARSKGVLNTGLAADLENPDVHYIVAKMDVDVAFDDSTTDFTLSKFQRATAPVSIFDLGSEPNAEGDLAIDPNDIVLGEAFSGTVTAQGSVLADFSGVLAYASSYGSTLTTGSGATLQAHEVDFSAGLNLRSTGGENFLLGHAGLQILTEVAISDEPSGDLESTGDAEPIIVQLREGYSGSGYAVQTD